MQKLYGCIGRTVQRVYDDTETVPDGWVELTNSRPSTKYVLNHSLEWVLRPMTEEEVHEARSIRYVTEVDPLLNEAKVKAAMGDTQGEAEALQKAVGKRIEIQNSLPYGKLME